MNIALTNDDGYSAEGIQALREELSKIYDVRLIAPKENKSAVSHSLTFFDSLEVKKIDADYDGFWVAGTPADCVRLVNLGILGKRPDVVISGINCGENVADDIVYSGTVSAAREAVLSGIKGIAVSMYTRHGTCDYKHAAKLFAAMLPGIMALDLPDYVLLNVNFPGTTEIEGVEITRMGKRIYVDKLKDEGGGFFKIKLMKPDFVKDEGTDVVAISKNKISITPLQIDLTDHVVLEKLQKLEDADFTRVLKESI